MHRDIGRANSSIFTTLDLTSGFWQMKQRQESQPLTAFTIPHRGQFHWITLHMGLLGCPESYALGKLTHIEKSMTFLNMG